MKEKQSLQQQVRALENTIDTGSRDSSEKDNRLRELEGLLAKEKTENQRLENERSDLVAKVNSLNSNRTIAFTTLLLDATVSFKFLRIRLREFSYQLEVLQNNRK